LTTNYTNSNSKHIEDQDETLESRLAQNPIPSDSAKKFVKPTHRQIGRNIIVEAKHALR